MHRVFLKMKLRQGKAKTTKALKICKMDLNDHNTEEIRGPCSKKYCKRENVVEGLLGVRAYLYTKIETGPHSRFEIWCFAC